MYISRILLLAFLQVSLLTSSLLASTIEVHDQCRETFDESLFVDGRNEIYYYKRKARKAQTQGHLASALGWTQECLELNPDELECHQMAAALCLKLSRFTESSEHHYEVIRIEGPTTINLEKLMNVYLKARRPLEALKTFEMALDHSIVSRRLARMVTLATGEVRPTALEMTYKWLNDKPNDPLLLRLQIKFLTQLERYDEAMEIVEQKLAQGPEDTEFLDLKAQILQEQHRFDDSLKLAGQVLEQNPRNMLAFSVKVDALNGLARFDEAHALLDVRLAEAIQSSFGRSGDAYIFKTKFAVLMTDGHYEEALAFVRSQQVWQTDSKLSLALQMEALLALDKNDEAIHLGLQGIEKYPETALTLSRTAEALMGLEEADAAHTALDQALRVTFSSLRAAALKSLLWVQENNGGRALEALDLIRKRYPAESSAIEIYLLARLGQFDLSRAIITSWPHLEKYEELVTTASAYFYLKSQNYDKALQLSEALLTSNPRHRLGQILRRLALLGLKDFDRAPPIQQQQGRDARLEAIFQAQVQKALQDPSWRLKLPPEVDDEILFSLVRLGERG